MAIYVLIVLILTASFSFTTIGYALMKFEENKGAILLLLILGILNITAIIFQAKAL